MSIQNMSANSRALPTSSDPLDSKLQAAARRIRALLFVRMGSYALFASTLVCLLAVGMSKLRIWAEPSPWAIVGVIALAVLAVALFVATRPLPMLQVARLTDRRTDLKERLSSALEFRALGVETGAPFYTEQMLDASRHAAGIDLKTVYPVRIPRVFWAGIVAAIALFGFYFLPTLPAFWSKEKKQEQEEVKKNGIQIIKVAQDTTKTANQQDLKETKKAAQEAQKLGEAMQKAKMNKKESLIALQKLTRKMEETQQKMAEAQQREMEKAKQAGADFKKSLEQMQKEVQEKRQEEAVRKAEEAKNNPEKSPNAKSAQNKNDKQGQQQQQSPQSKQAQQAMQQMAEALANMDKQQMQQAMQKLADQIQSGKMSKEEMKQLQKALQQLSKNLEQSGQKEQAQQMQQMAQQMQNSMNNMDPQTLQNMAQMARNLGQQMNKPGSADKDALDQKTLEGLAQQMKDGKMSLAMGGKPGFGGKGPGKGFGGEGHPTSPMKDPKTTSPRLLAAGKPGEGKGIGKSKSAEEFAKYAAMKSSPPKFLPNGKVAGERSKNGNELQLNMTGDPEAFKSNTPYYQAYISSRKQAESSLNKENIPVAYKKQVKDYFDSIKP